MVSSELVVHAQVILPLLIFTFGPISGAHFNPMVTSVFVATKQMVGSSLVHLLIQIPIYKSIASSCLSICPLRLSGSILKLHAQPMQASPSRSGLGCGVSWWS